jgi:hypothetical protein
VRARQRGEGRRVATVLGGVEVAGERAAELARDRRDPRPVEGHAQHGRSRGG